MHVSGATSVRAAGFELLEQSAVGVGQAFAGAATGFGDGSEVYFNPAALSRVAPNTVSASIHGIFPTAEWNDRGSSLIPQLGGSRMTGGDGSDGGENAIVPNFYGVAKINEYVNFGLGVYAPFGLATEYDSDWVGRYHAVKSELKTINITPALSSRLGEMVSLGASFSVMYADAELTNAVDFGSIGVASLGLPTAGRLGLLPQQADGFAKVDGDDWSYGFGLGMLVEPADWLRVGVSYRSETHLSLEGSGNFEVPANAQILTSSGAFTDTGARAGATLPQEVMIGIAADVTDDFSLYADAQWTRWSKFNELRVEFDSVQPDSVQDESWKNARRIALGGRYKVNDSWAVKAGVAYDESPVPDAARRTPRIPDNDRFWVSAGVQYALSERTQFELGYSHLFVDDVSTDITNNTGSRLVGEWDLGVDIVSAAVTTRF